MAPQLSFLSLLLIPSILHAQAIALPRIERRAQLQTFTPEAFSPATANEVTQNYQTLQRGSSKSSSFAALSALQQGNSISKRQSTPSAPLISAIGGVEYLVQIVFGSQTVKAILDTGSSDTWLIQQGFQCTDASGTAQPESTCNFGPAYSGSFGSNQIQNENFNISYGDGEFVTGQMGYEDVTIAGITVPHQEVALGTSAFWNGDGISSGLVGLAYPAITSAFSGTDPTTDSSSNRVQYDPLFTTMYKQNLSSAMFSLAIQRGSDAGYIAFGGLPPVSFNQTFATASIQVLSLGSSRSDTFYTITPDAIVYSGSGKTQSNQYIVDSGTTLVYLPTAAARAVNNLFSPKAQFSSSQGAYFVNCKAKAPAFGVEIGGTTFQVNAADMIYQNQTDPQTGLCLTGIQDGGSGPYILGDVFLQNVVAVFDVGAAEMRFAAHTY